MNNNIKKNIKSVAYKVNRNPLSKLLYQSSIEKRSRMALTDIKGLSGNINLFAPFTSEIHEPNDWYGHAKIFKQFLGLPENHQFKFIIEHGLHLVEDILSIELETDLPSFVTYSDFRAQIIKKYSKVPFCVGPFINYASSSLSIEEILSEKKRLGKSILVFPSHSSGDLDFHYNITEFCKKVKKIGKKYNSIRVCLYWKEAQAEHAKYYNSFGFECVTAGHILDPLFLPRLKSIIEISDLTISNVAGNHVGYSIFMNKPHIILPQIHQINGRKSEKKLLEEAWWKSPSYQAIVKEFTNISDKITPRQRSLVNYYWGVDKIKTKNEFLKIVKKTEEIFKNYN